MARKRNSDGPRGATPWTDKQTRQELARRREQRGQDQGYVPSRHAVGSDYKGLDAHDVRRHEKAEKPRMSVARKFSIAALLGTALAVAPFISENAALDDEIDHRTIDAGMVDAAMAENCGVFVLTGGAGRMNAGIELGEKLQCPVFVSGANETYRDQVERMYSTADTEIIVGYNAKDTIGNALEIKNWLDMNPHIDDVIIVTSDYHMPRALQAVERTIDMDRYNVQLLPVSAERSLVAEARVFSQEYVKTGLLGYPMIGQSLHDDSVEEYGLETPDSHLMRAAGSRIKQADLDSHTTFKP